MCRRYSITTPVEGLRRLFRFAGPLPNLPPRYNVAATQQMPIVRVARDDRHKRELAMVRWGLIPFWAKDAAIGSKFINARAERNIDLPHDKNESMPIFHATNRTGMRLGVVLVLGDQVVLRGA